MEVCLIMVIVWMVAHADEANSAIILEPNEEKQSVTVHQPGVSSGHLLPEEKHPASKAYISGNYQNVKLKMRRNKHSMLSRICVFTLKNCVYCNFRPIRRRSA